MKRLILIIILLQVVSYTRSFSQIIRINEFSQGNSGAKEWVELVVGSTSPVNNTNCVLAKVNISGWVLDDNNGDFSPTNHFTGSGVAPGHMRFKNVQPWNNLPIGAIIVIYNAADRDLSIPADDPFDWVNNDCVYIIPSNHSSIEYCTSLPIVTNCTTRTDYGVCSYVSTGNWNNVSLANAGDAIQLRDPSFNLVHGLVYGKSTSASGCATTPDMVGGPLSPLISNLAMSATAASFIGTNDNDYFDPTKWVIIPANSATPGTFNNASNQTFIVNTLRGGCTCARVLPLDDKDESIIPNRDEPKLEYKQIGSYLFFHNQKQTNLTLRVFSTDGRYISGIRTNFKNDYAFHLPLGLFYVIVYAEYGSNQDIFTIKLSNFELWK